MRQLVKVCKVYLSLSVVRLLAKETALLKLDRILLSKVTLEFAALS